MLRFRCAISPDFAEEWRQPENPAKESDARYRTYVARYGHSSWELDAIEPTALANLVKKSVLKVRDEHLWQLAVIKENAMKRQLENIASTYGKGT